MKTRIEAIKLGRDSHKTYFVDYSRDGKEWLNYGSSKNYAEAEKYMKSIMIKEVFL